MVKAPPPRRDRKKPFFLILGAVAVIGIVLIAMQARGSGPSPQIVAELPPGDAGQAQPYVYGRPDAPVAISEFADFECPACAQFATLTEPDVRKRLADAGQVSFRFYDFPLDQHRNSVLASLSAACAADQNKFWEMHDRIFAGQDAWATRPGESDASANRRGGRLFAEYARAIGLDEGAWSTCVEEQRHLNRIPICTGTRFWRRSRRRAPLTRTSSGRCTIAFSRGRTPGRRVPGSRTRPQTGVAAGCSRSTRERSASTRGHGPPASRSSGI